MQHDKLAARAELGRRAEALAAEHLERQGFEILARNAQVGRLEIDLIARRGTLLVFCEVRSRSDARFISPADTITYEKIRRVRHAARDWMSAGGVRAAEIRFDAACVVFDRPDGSLTYYEAAF